MSRLKSSQLDQIDLFFRGSGPGYILNFSNRTFSEFFAEYLDVDIYADEYAQHGGSKANRLKGFLTAVDDHTALKTIIALKGYKESLRLDLNHTIPATLVEKIERICATLAESADDTPRQLIQPTGEDTEKFSRFLKRIINIRDMEPHSRGYAFEKFLFDLFSDFHLKPRGPFNLKGEQIDGSFVLDAETYLLEAKWLKVKVGIQELGGFHTKLEQKAQWTRGAFVSFQGFSEDGLHAIGRGRRLICVSGKDLHDALSKEISPSQLLRLKVRHASETGSIYVPLEELIQKSK